MAKRKAEILLTRITVCSGIFEVDKYQKVKYPESNRKIVPKVSH